MRLALLLFRSAAPFAADPMPESTWVTIVYPARY
jgi:hypothetical protein